MVSVLLTIFISSTMVSCSGRPEAPLSLHWELLANDVEPGICEAALTITNNTNQPIEKDGWILGFSLMSLHPLYAEGDELRETEVMASYHTIEPTAAFVPIAPNESRTFKLCYKGSEIGRAHV